MQSVRCVSGSAAVVTLDADTVVADAVVAARAEVWAPGCEPQPASEISAAARAP
jgi:hypothetical protein